MNWSLLFEPLIPMTWLYGAGLAALAAAALSFLTRAPAPYTRTLALGLMVLALANPVLREEERDPLPGVVVIATDKSASQRLAERDQTSEQTRQALYDTLAEMKGVDLRQVTISDSDDGTQLITSLEKTLADVPADRISGVFMITDGQVHDAEDKAGKLGFTAPVHALVSGSEDEVDRRIIVHQKPRFALVRTEQPVTFRVEDLGRTEEGPQRVEVTISRDGERLSTKRVTVGENVTVPVEIAHGGRNLFELAVESLPGELTHVNNRVVIETDGIREKLRVLLVSGAPHAGERTWRNVLKSDAAVDLVHFTILRPPDKQDGTPISDLALIAFPTRELFSEKIDEFDLIIFDRYARMGVLPSLYFSNIADYVRGGGALLVSAGPEYGSGISLYRTSLSDILPAQPTGRVNETGFHATLSSDGTKHPITRELEGARSDPPRWGRWFRSVDTRADSGRVLLQGSTGEPILITAQAGEGRVATLLSDQAWLWARGFEGGGPYVDLFRRLGHWLMRETALEEEQLAARLIGGEIVIERRTMGNTAGPVVVTGPAGNRQSIPLEEVGDGLWTGRIASPNPGIYQFADGKLTAIADAGQVNPREFTDTRSTLEVLRPVVEANRGSIRRVASAEDLPRILPIRAGATAYGPDWLGVERSRATILRSISTYPALTGLAGLLLLISAIAGTWYRERG